MSDVERMIRGWLEELVAHKFVEEVRAGKTPNRAILEKVAELVSRSLAESPPFGGLSPDQALRMSLFIYVEIIRAQGRFDSRNEAIQFCYQFHPEEKKKVLRWYAKGTYPEYKRFAEEHAKSIVSRKDQREYWLDFFEQWFQKIPPDSAG